MDVYSYGVLLLPILNGLGAWRVRKMNQEPLVQPKEIGFFLRAVDVAKAKVFPRQRIRGENISLHSFFQFLCRYCRRRCSSDIEMHQALII